MRLPYALRISLNAFFLLLMLTLLSSCGSPREKAQEDTRLLLNTVVTLKIWGDHPPAVLEDAFTLIQEYEALLSRHREGSDLDRLNKAPAGSPVKVSPPALTIAAKALHLAQISQGAFDPTIGPLVDLWGIGTETPVIPSPEEIQKALAKVDYRQLHINQEEGSLSLGKEGMILDLGGITKGWIADETARYFQETGVAHFIINLGGNVLVRGGKPGDIPFKIGMQDPFDNRGTYRGIFSLSQGSVVSSGNYERYFEQDGRRYHHILDSQTGYPAEKGLASVTVLSEESMDGDGLSTALFALGIEEGMALLKGLPRVEGVFIKSDGELIMTPKAQAVFTE